MVSVVIPYRDLGVPERRASFDFVTDFWRRVLPDAELVVESRVEPFTRARALNAAVSRSSGEVILQSDPDSFVPKAQALAAIALAAEGDGLVVAFGEYVYLDEATSRAVIAERGSVPLDATSEERGRGGVGNVTAYSYETWQTVSGYDERFGLWGGDDGAFAYAADRLVAPLRRVHGPMYHLWHPRLPESVPGHPAYAEQFSIVERYRDAETADDIRALIAERA